jgi:hypothetical protein
VHNPTHPTRRTPATVAPTVDLLEPRRLLSAAVDHRILVVEGTPRADTIVVTNDSPKTLRVRIGDAESTFLKRSFGKIRITAGRGDDLVTVGSDANPVAIPCAVTGDDGSDTLLGGAAADNLSGGGGADQVSGAAGDDTVSGDNGDDDLHGGDGDDTLAGGRGDDRLHDNAGEDKCAGNAGADLLYYDGAKPNKLRDAEKSEAVYAEPTFNIKKRLHAAAVLNNCPLDLVDGRHVDGGLIRAGGSTLVVSGAVLKQWRGPGLETSSAKIPHFDLAGGAYLSGAGSLTINGSAITLVGMNGNNITGGVVVSNSGLLTGSTMTADDSLLKLAQNIAVEGVPASAT